MTIKKTILILALFYAVSAFGAQPTSRFYNWSRATLGVTNGIPNYPVGSTVTADTTGAADASAAIQSAINAASGTKTAVFLPDGTYLINTMVSLRSQMALRGSSNVIFKANNGFNPTVGVGWDIDGFPQPDAAPPSVVSGATAGSTSITLSSATGWPTSDRMMEIRAYPNITNEAMTAFGPVLSTSSTTAFGNQQNRRAGFGQAVRIISRSGNTINFWPPLVRDFTNSPVCIYYANALKEAGVEGITFDFKISGVQNNNSLEAIAFHQAFNVWAKGVTVKSQPRKGFTFDRCANIEVRDCVLWDHPANGSNGECVDMQQGVSGYLIENNIFYKQFPGICIADADSGVQAGAVLYNFFAWPSVVGGGPGSVCNPDILIHGYHPHGLLSEGNFGTKFQADGYYGGSQYSTLFRDRWIGEHPDSNVTVGEQAVSLDRWAMNWSVGSCVLGTNTTTRYEWTGQTDGALSIWRLGAPNPGRDDVPGGYFSSVGSQPDWFFPGTTTIDTAVSSGNNRFGPLTAATSVSVLPGDYTGLLQGTAKNPGPGTNYYSIAIQDGSNTNNYIYVSSIYGGEATGLQISTPVSYGNGTYFSTLNTASWQRHFPEVKNTLIRAGNYDFNRSAFDSDAAWDAFPQSLFADYASAPPSWWPSTSTLRFPPVQPADATKVTMNPAMARYYGIDVYSGGGGTTGGGTGTTTNAIGRSKIDGRVKLNGRVQIK